MCDTPVTWGGTETHQYPQNISRATGWWPAGPLGDDQQGHWWWPEGPLGVTSKATGWWPVGPLVMTSRATGDDQRSQHLAHAHYLSHRISLLDTDVDAMAKKRTQIWREYGQSQQCSRDSSLPTKTGRAGVGTQDVRGTPPQEAEWPPRWPWQRQQADYGWTTWSQRGKDRWDKLENGFFLSHIQSW